MSSYCNPISVFKVTRPDQQTGGNVRIERQTLIDSPRKFKVLHQTLCINSIDFDSQTLFGYTELAVLPICLNLRSIRLNCSKECRVNRVTVQETIDAAFIHDDCFASFRQKVSELTENEGEKSLDLISDSLSQAASKIDPDKGGGELLIKFPSEIFKLADEQKLIRVGIDFNLEKPKNGLKFVYYGQLEGSSWRDRAPHLFSWKHPDHSTHSSWFPCVDTWSELCTWKIEVSCDTALTAICSGELQDVSYTSDLRRKNYQYTLTIPTPACNIGVCVGVFDIYVHPDMNELSAFCPPQLVPLLKHTCRNLHKIFEFFEELMSSRYPYGSFKIVFVDDLPILDPNNVLTYSSLIVMHVKCLYHKKIIDQVPITRMSIAYGVANQFFGCYMVPHKFVDRWICLGLAEYITALFRQRFFGNNEFLYDVYQKLKDVTEFESKWGGVILNPTGGGVNSGTGSGQQQQPDEKKSKSLNITCPILCSTWFREIYVKKSFLVLRILEKKLGKELLLQVMNKLLSVCSHCAQQQRLTPITWSNMLLSTDSFSKCVSNVTGHDLQSFVDQWVRQGGHAEFVVNLSFNRKRNTIELDVKQDLSSLGTVKYVGPVSVTVQELDGSFTHTLQIDDVSSRHDIQCHSKARRQRKRKIPLWTGEEVDMDLSSLDPDSPLLWLRFDPDLLTLGRTTLHQPDNQWQYQLRHERDVVAQFQALNVLPKYPSPQTRAVILDIIKNEQCFYRVRCAACFSLAHVINKLAGTWTTPPAVLSLFTGLFGSKSCPQIPRLNNFSNLQHYFLAKSIISSMALIRSTANICPDEIHQFLLFICKFNNNTQNKFLDDHYRANYFEAFGRSTSSLNNTPKNSLIVEKSSEELLNQIKKMTTELTHALNLEKIKPSYNRVVVAGALKGLIEIQKSCHLHEKPGGGGQKGQKSMNGTIVLDDLNLEEDSTNHLQLWWAYAKNDCYLPIRLAALECIVDFLTDLNPATSGHSSVGSAANADSSTFDANISKLMDLFKDEVDPLLRTFAGLKLLKNLTLTARPEIQLSFKNDKKLLDRLWASLATQHFYDGSSRCAILDIIQRLSLDVDGAGTSERSDSLTVTAQFSTEDENNVGGLGFLQQEPTTQHFLQSVVEPVISSLSPIGLGSTSPRVVVASDDWMEIKVFDQPTTTDTDPLSTSTKSD